jgi:hypothetical protein
VLVLDHREAPGVSLSGLPEVIEEIANQILTPPIAMTELLAHIHAAVERKGRSGIGDWGSEIGP